MNKIFGVFITCFLSFTTVRGQNSASNDSITAINIDSVLVDVIALNWSLTYKEALQKSKKEKKPILIYFAGSDWCGPCKILDSELFQTEKFKELSDKSLVLLEVDIPRRRDILSPSKMKENLYLQKKYRVEAFPTLMVVNHRGKKIAEKKGYIMTEYYYPFLQSAIRKY